MYNFGSVYVVYNYVIIMALAVMNLYSELVLDDLSEIPIPLHFNVVIF